MSAPVEDLVSRLHAKRSGKGWIARCPAHEDHTPSLSIDEGTDGCALINCLAGCTLDAVLSAIGLTKKDLFSRNALPSSSRNRGPQRSTPTAIAFDWQKCIDAFTEKHVEHVAKWRGFSLEFLRELRDAKLIGIFDGLVAFPVHKGGQIVGCHYRSKQSNNPWYYFPKGIKAAPFVIGELTRGERVQCFESTWDGLDYMDKSGERDGMIITRGASNGALVAELIPEGSTAYLWTHNDVAGEKWQKDVCANTTATVKRVRIPAPHKDLNDWTRAGATDKDLLGAMVHAKTLREPPRALIEFRSPLQLRNFTPPPGIVLVGDCHVVRGSVFVIGGAPGIGKSRASVALARSRGAQNRMVRSDRAPKVQGDDYPERERRISSCTRISRAEL